MGSYAASGVLQPDGRHMIQIVPTFPDIGDFIHFWEDDDYHRGIYLGVKVTDEYARPLRGERERECHTILSPMGLVYFPIDFWRPNVRGKISEALLG